ncbi:hypothetical protein Pfo_013668 [Paulownia fortunei]|nr:hypothetical protein Pfo_013668 [Paulownia fortunei]
MASYTKSTPVQINKQLAFEQKNFVLDNKCCTVNKIYFFLLSSFFSQFLSFFSRFFLLLSFVLFSSSCLLFLISFYFPFSPPFSLAQHLRCRLSELPLSPSSAFFSHQIGKCSFSSSSNWG